MNDNIPSPPSEEWPLPVDPLGINYDPAVYWPAAGVQYESWADPVVYREQETALADVLSQLPWTTVLDLGCGYGRIGELVERIRPGTPYTGVDISPHQIKAAKRRLPVAELYVGTLLGWKPQHPARRWDLVIACEVLMHQPADQIHDVVARMFDWSSGHVVNCDWYEPDRTDEANAWNVAHNYPALYGPRWIRKRRVDRQMIFVATAGTR